MALFLTANRIAVALQRLAESRAKAAAVVDYLRSQLGPRTRRTAAELGDQAARIVWRQLAIWLRAQLAIVEIGIASPGEVLMPYAIGDTGMTMWEAFSSKLLLAAPAGGTR